MNPIKPGTRCECKNDACQANATHGTMATGYQCASDAVRLVTFYHVPSRLDIAIGADKESKHTLALCAACAAYHESKGA
jgi:hypothetical protein